jgi:hypothetical protein
MFEINQETKEMAKAYDQRGGYITEAGKYIGHFENVIWHVKDGDKGRSEGMFLDFVTESKQKASIYINTSYQGGTPNISGQNMVYAILTCMRMRSAGEPVDCPVKTWDKDQLKEIDVIKSCFTQMHKKPIGLVMQMVHEDGQEYPRPQIYGVFEPSTEFTASEILNNAQEPKTLGKFMAVIADKPIWDKRKGTSAANVPPPVRKPASPVGGSDVPPDDIDSDIPFAKINSKIY